MKIYNTNYTMTLIKGDLKKHETIRAIRIFVLFVFQGCIFGAR